MPAVMAQTKTFQYRDHSKGMNQTSARPALRDDEIWYAENIQPIGSGQLRVLPPAGPTLTSIGAGIATLWGVTMKLAGVETTRLITINNDGSITAINPTNGAQTAVAPAGTVTTKARLSMWQDGPLLIGDPSTGYFTWNGTSLTAYPAPAPANVTDLAVFQGRVCALSASRAVTLSAPASFSDFATADGAFTFTLTDSVFAGSITRLLSALEVLWVMGPSAVNALSNIQIVSGQTTLSNTNIVANVGTQLPSSVTSFFRTFLFLTPYGVYAIVGATPQKLSEQLDGFFPFLTFGTDQPAGIVSLNRVFVWCVLVTYTDPATNTPRPVLLCLSRNAWFVASQGTLTWIASLVNLATGNPELWGTDGTNIFKCFAGTGAGFYNLQTKFYDYGAFTQRKQMLRMAIELQQPSPTINLNAMVTNELGQSTTVNLSAVGSTIVFVGSGPITFTGAGGVAIVWTLNTLSAKGVVNMSGDYLGVQLTGTSLPFTISGLAYEIDPLGEWT